jgi:hypothetical protein
MLILNSLNFSKFRQKLYQNNSFFFLPTCTYGRKKKDKLNNFQKFVLEDNRFLLKFTKENTFFN